MFSQVSPGDQSYVCSILSQAFSTFSGLIGSRIVNKQSIAHIQLKFFSSSTSSHKLHLKSNLMYVLFLYEVLFLFPRLIWSWITKEWSRIINEWLILGLFLQTLPWDKSYVCSILSQAFSTFFGTNLIQNSQQTIHPTHFTQYSFIIHFFSQVLFGEQSYIYSNFSRAFFTLSRTDLIQINQWVIQNNQQVIDLRFNLTQDSQVYQNNHQQLFLGLF